MAIDFEHYAATGEKTPLSENTDSPYSDELVALVVDEIANGAGVRATAKKYRVSKSAVSRWVNGYCRTDRSLYDIKADEIKARAE